MMSAVMKLHRLQGMGQVLFRLASPAREFSSGFSPASARICSSIWAGRRATQKSVHTSSTNDHFVDVSSQKPTLHQKHSRISNLPTILPHQKNFLSSKAEAQTDKESVVDAEEIETGSVAVKFGEGGQQFSYQTTWLRDNCQCSQCFNSSALGRSQLLETFQLKPEIAKVSVTSGGELEVVWKDEHISIYNADWLRQRAFTEEARQKYRNIYKPSKVLWRAGHQLPQFTFSSLMDDDRDLLRWLLELEVSGATFVSGVPSDPAAANHLCDRVAIAKATHYGFVSDVVTIPSANNLAYTNNALNLHNDMPTYDEVPGLLILHMVEQTDGEGGDTVISDGYAAAEHMREHHPDMYTTLTDTPVYFWDRGAGQRPGEMEEFYKINMEHTIEVDRDGAVCGISFNNQIRDSFLDLPSARVDGFYEALQTFYETMKQFSISFKMENGEMTVLDNTRCQHGKKAILGGSNRRHLANAYMSWDEVRCKRRRLQLQLGAGQG